MLYPVLKRLSLYCVFITCFFLLAPSAQAQDSPVFAPALPSSMELPVVALGNAGKRVFVTRREALKVRARTLPAWSPWFALDLALGGAFEFQRQELSFLGRLNLGFTLLYESVYNRLAISVGAFGEFISPDLFVVGGYIEFLSQREGAWVQLAMGIPITEEGGTMLRASIGWSIFGLDVFYLQFNTLVDNTAFGVGLHLRIPISLFTRHLTVKDKPVLLR